MHSYDTLRCNAKTGKTTLRRKKFPPSSSIEHTKEECLLQVLLGLKSLLLKSMGVYIDVSTKLVS